MALPGATKHGPAEEELLEGAEDDAETGNAAEAPVAKGKRARFT